jgi:hypothetical protein
VKRASFRRVRVSEKGVKDRGNSKVYRVSVSSDEVESEQKSEVYRVSISLRLKVKKVEFRECQYERRSKRTQFQERERSQKARFRRGRESENEVESGKS